MTINKNIIINKFNDFVLEMTLFDVAVYDLTGITACMQVKRYAIDDVPIVSLTTENYGITIGGTSGTIDLFIHNSVTATLPTMDAFYDLMLIYPNGDRVLLMQGMASIVRDTSGGVSVDKQSVAVGALFPRGRAWDNVMTIGTNLNNLCRALSEIIVDFKNDVYKLHKEIYFSTHTSITNDLRLIEYGLPNSCDPQGRTLGIIENGLDTSQTLLEIIEQALSFLGLNAVVIDEIVNDIPKTLSIIINSNSPVFGSCLQIAGSASCDIYTGAESCTDTMYAGASPYQFMPNLDCIFKQVIPLGWTANFYLDTKEAPLFIGN